MTQLLFLVIHKIVHITPFLFSLRNMTVFCVLGKLKR